jgi:tight adherence protein B
MLIGAAAVVLFLVGLREVTTLAGERRRLVAAVAGADDPRDVPVIERWDAVFRTTRVGRAVERELTLAGLSQPPVVVAAVAAVSGVALGWVLWTALAPIFGILGLAGGVFLVRTFIRRAKARRTEVFIGQMPELARVLANATNAGLSIATALGIAGDELDEPARSEMQRVSSSLRFGSDMDSALEELGQRVPSREVAVLLSTLIVCARSGGSLVTSLRDIAETLDARKETRREIRTTLAQSLATGYLVIVLGFGMLFLLNAIQPGTVEAMTTNFIGQVALVVSGGLFVGGFLVIRRMTRVDL